MIKLTYQTEDGMVESTFDTVEELENFRNALRTRREKEDLEKAEKIRKESVERETLQRSRTNELKKEMISLLLKAKNYGMTPSFVVDLITESLNELVSGTADFSGADGHEAEE